MPEPLVASLTPEKALIFRITHRDNVPWILENGLHCKNSSTQDPDFTTIGNRELIEKRTDRSVPISPGGSLSDYIPFYFTPFSPMMYNIHTGHGGVPRRGNDEIVVLASSLPMLVSTSIPFIFSDRHAYLHAAEFFGDLSNIERIDFSLLRQRDFRRDPENPEKIERYQAEALVHREMPASALLGIVCYSNDVLTGIKREVQNRHLDLQIHSRPGWYF